MFVQPLFVGHAFIDATFFAAYRTHTLQAKAAFFAASSNGNPLTITVNALDGLGDLFAVNEDMSIGISSELRMARQNQRLIIEQL